MSEEEKKGEMVLRPFPNYHEEYKWAKSDKIGIGGFGAVYKAVKGGKTSVAIKKFKFQLSDEEDKEDLRSIIMEMRILTHLPHPLVIEYLDSFRDNDDNVYLVLELAE